MSSATSTSHSSTGSLAIAENSLGTRRTLCKHFHLAKGQSTLDAAQQNLLDNDCQHQLDVMLIETPWASLSGSSGSSGN